MYKICGYDVCGCDACGWVRADLAREVAAGNLYCCLPSIVGVILAPTDEILESKNQHNEVEHIL